MQSNRSHITRWLILKGIVKVRFSDFYNAVCVCVNKCTIDMVFTVIFFSDSNIKFSIVTIIKFSHLWGTHSTFIPKVQILFHLFIFRQVLSLSRNDNNLLILLSLPLQCFDYSRVAACLASNSTFFDYVHNPVI